MDLFKVVFGDPEIMDQEDLKYAHEIIGIAERLSDHAKEVLFKLRDKGPVTDGDIPSKWGRDMLLECLAAVRVVVRGEQGYTACTYAGYDIAKVLEAMRANT